MFIHFSGHPVTDDVQVPTPLPETIYDFPIRRYGRTELAERYHPESRGKSAWEKFKYELDLCTDLQTALATAGYDPHRRHFTPTEVWIIAQFLSVP